jgi:hypothetical protein
MALDGILTGAIGMALLVAALFFLRFWRSTGDRFFLFFAASFFIEGGNRLVLYPAPEDMDHFPGVVFYLLRFSAYLLILWAIVDKNRGKGGR